MKKMNSKKMIITTIGSLMCCAIFSTSFAAENAKSTQGSNVDTNAIVAAINYLGEKVKAVGYSTNATINNLVYQIDQHLPTIMKLNTVTVNGNSVKQETKKAADAATQESISNDLKTFSYTVTPPSRLSAEYKEMQQQQAENSVSVLTAGTKASDTLYSDPNKDQFKAIRLGTAKPKVVHDNYFNFDTLYSPTSYNVDTEKAAQQFMKYLTKSYEPLTTGVDLDKLRNKSPEQLAEFMKSPAYQKYQLTVRSSLAARSILNSNMNYLIAERTPIKGLGEAAGLPTKDASPLQVQDYIANHRIHGPQAKQWYQQIANATPATVQRETLYVLAEIESQLQQSHMDHERMIATLTGLALEASSTNKMMVQGQAQEVNKAIDAATK